MPYLIEPRDKQKNISTKYSPKLVGSAKKSATDAIKTA